jgi:UDP:flavonoid glycosyltransferase YjiC (YdhE family)
MVLIGAHLQNLGHYVRVLTGEEYSDLVTDFNLGFAPLDGAAQPVAPTAVSAIPRVLPRLVRRYLTGLSDVRSTFVAPLAAQHRALDRVLEAEPAEVVLVDLAFTGALPLVAAKGPRPAVLVCGVGPLTLTSADSPPFGMSWMPRAGMDYSGMHAVVDRMMFRGIRNELNAALSDIGAPDIEVSVLDWPRLADRVMQLTVAEFEYPRRDLPGNLEFVGPVLPGTDDGFEPPAWWDAVLRADTVVHVTQGTFDNGDLDQLIAPTLRALADADGVVVVATTGRCGRQRLPAEVPMNAYVAEWIPYSVLMPHVDVMITNGGYGGVQHAIRYGIPVVVAGESNDKAEVAARVEYAGVGVNLRTAHPSPEAIAAAVREAGDRRDAARRLGATIARATPLDRIAELVAEEIARLGADARS